MSWGGEDGGGYMGDYGDAPGNVSNEGSWGGNGGIWGSGSDPFGSANEAARVQALQSGGFLGAEGGGGQESWWAPTIRDMSLAATNMKGLLQGNKAGLVLGTVAGGIFGIPGAGLFGAAVQQGFKDWSNQTPEQRMAAIDSMVSQQLQDQLGNTSGNIQMGGMGGQAGAGVGAGGNLTPANDWSGVPSWWVKQALGHEKMWWDPNMGGWQEIPMEAGMSNKLIQSYNQYVQGVNDPVGSAMQSQEYQQAKQDIYGMLQEWYSTTGLDSASELTNLANMTGGLTDHEKSLLDTVQNNAISKLQSTLEDQRSRVMATALSRLTNKGIMDSTIAAGLMGDIEAEVLKQLGQGTADITSKRMVSELELGQRRQEMGQDWQKALLSAYTTQRGQDLGITQREADRQLELAIANMQKDYADESNWWTAGGSLLGGLLSNWDSIFG